MDELPDGDGASHSNNSTARPASPVYAAASEVGDSVDGSAERRASNGDDRSPATRTNTYGDDDALIEEAIEEALAATLDPRASPAAPARLAGAVRFAVFPGGARIRPRLCLTVADAYGRDGAKDRALPAAAAIEMLHCASLVHDDLPCFDNADMRRGKPSAHRAWGESLAVLAGDALIVAAFQTLAQRYEDGALLSRLTLIIGAAVGAAGGLIAGQAWESEPSIDRRAYHRAKTGALFVAPAMAGAACAGDDPEQWRAFGERLGEAYQIADDMRDSLASAESLGKPAGQDLRNGRPNSVDALGREGAEEQLRDLIRDAADAVPQCPGEGSLRRLLAVEARRLSVVWAGRGAA